MRATIFFCVLNEEGGRPFYSATFFAGFYLKGWEGGGRGAGGAGGFSLCATWSSNHFSFTPARFLNSSERCMKWKKEQQNDTVKTWGSFPFSVFSFYSFLFYFWKKNEWCWFWSPGRRPSDAASRRPAPLRPVWQRRRRRSSSQKKIKDPTIFFDAKWVHSRTWSIWFRYLRISIGRVAWIGPDKMIFSTPDGRRHLLRAFASLQPWRSFFLSPVIDSSSSPALR